MQNKPIIFYRDMNAEELSAAKSNFYCIDSRVKVEKNDLIIGRYSMLPFYKHTEYDITYLGANLINSYRQHRYVADIWNWIQDFEGITPKTYNRLEDLTTNGPFVLKGETNSRKHQWNTDMFAKDKTAAINVYCKLQLDGLLSYQDIYIRDYVPLKTYLIGICGLPITKEFRLFICDGAVVSKAFYWQNYIDDLPDGIVPDVNDIPQSFIDDVIKRIDNHIRFYVVDIAQTESGEWIVIELNDGQMSGLSCNDPNVLYSNLKKVLYNE